MSELDRLRLRGIELLVGGAWVNTLGLILLGILTSSERMVPAVVIAVVANLLPSAFAARHRHDHIARMTVATLAAVHPALAVYMLGGHPYQMDFHMYFFVALAALTLLYDWRPIALASVMIAVHHILFDAIAPDWVFAGSGSILRIAIHAIAVLLQFFVLAYLTTRMRGLIENQAKAARDSDAAALGAIAGRTRAEDAIEALRAAEARAADERTARQQIENEAVARSRAEMLALADAFQQSVAAVTGAVGTASADLAQLAASLNDRARQASRDITDAAATASQASSNAGTLATGVRELSHSITAIGTSVDAQARLTGEASALSTSGHDAVRALNDRSTTISSFAESIYEIASRTNLLALNATIEAARAGDVGRGFAVVATEVKGLAGQASAATGEIRTLAGAVLDGADVANSALQKINGTMAHLAEAAQTISQSIDGQRNSIGVIGAAADETALGAADIARRIAGIVDVASDTEELSTRVSEAASGLLQTATDLQQATGRFVAQLRAA